MSAFIAVSLITAEFCIREHLLLIGGCKFQVQVSLSQIKMVSAEAGELSLKLIWSHLSRTMLLVYWASQWYDINSLKLVCNKRVWNGWVPAVNCLFLRSIPFLVPGSMTTLPSMSQGLYWCMWNSPAICMLVPVVSVLGQARVTLLGNKSESCGKEIISRKQCVSSCLWWWVSTYCWQELLSQARHCCYCLRATASFRSSCRQSAWNAVAHKLSMPSWNGPVWARGQK